MPEGLEAEIYRRSAAAVTGRTIESVDVDPRQDFALEIAGDLLGRTVVAARRHGKLVLLDLTGELTLALHFGMTGRLIVDGEASIDQLEYASGRDDPAWDRLLIRFEDGSGGGVVRVNDPRRWARFLLDPDLSRLGPDLFSITAAELEPRLARRRTATKAALLDQGVVAGLGNLLVDEMLWHAAIDPRRPANSLRTAEVEHLVDTISDRLPTMLAAGGSHRGVLSPEVRAAQPACPHPNCVDVGTASSSNGHGLRRDVVGGRATIWCPSHQH